MKKLLLSLLAAVLAFPMFASKTESVPHSKNHVFNGWVSMWGATGQPNDVPQEGPFAELPQVTKVPGVDALSLGFMGWDKQGNLFTAWNPDEDKLSNEWLEHPKPQPNGEIRIVNPWYYLWTYCARLNTKVDYYMGAGGWSFGGGAVPNKKGEDVPGPNIWRNLVKMSNTDREKLATNIANFVNSPSPVYKNWSWWSQEAIQKYDTGVKFAGINLDLESCKEDGSGPEEFTPEMLNAVADLIGHLKNKGVDKIIATVMIKDYKDNMLSLLTNHFDNFYQIHVMAYDQGTKAYQKEGYKAEMEAFAKALTKNGKRSLNEVKDKMVVGLTACEQYTAPEDLDNGKKIVESVEQLEEKASWIVDNGFEGTFLWAIGQTYLVKDRHPGYTEIDIVKGIIRAMHK